LLLILEVSKIHFVMLGDATTMVLIFLIFLEPLDDDTRESELGLEEASEFDSTTCLGKH
jgi:hypothetical protein